MLSYLFENADGRRELLAEALVSDVSAAAEEIVESVERIRDALDLPSRLRDVDGPEPSAFPDVAESILTDPFMENRPHGLDPTVGDIENVLRDAY